MKRSIVIFASTLALGCQGSLLGDSETSQAGTPGSGAGSGAGAASGVSGGNGAGVSGAPGVDPAAGPLGRTPMRRLTLTEYAYTIRDLLGEDVSALVAGFPADGRTEGFDNVAASLDVATNQLDVFERAADALATRAVTAGSPARQRIAVCAEWADAACRRKVLQSFADKAWRRPATSTEVDQLLALAAIGKDASVDEQVALALRGVLLAPQFLFRVEKLPPAGTTAAYRVSGHELATRLSYFLWSSMPDDALAQSATAGTLVSAADVTREVSRMLGDTKAAGLTSNFAAQWLALRSLGDHQVDATLSAFTPALAASMTSESAGLFAHVLSKGLPASELLTATYGFMDEPLAKFYGVSVASGRAELAATERRGVLGQAALLTLTSYPNRTSIVRRGVWVMENLLCTEPPPPPEDVDTTPPDPAKGTLRQRMAQHSTNPTCAGCHTLMDPVGLGLENFDAIGRYREKENGEPIDASGTYIDGRPFNKPSELSKLVAEDPRFVACVAEKLLAFGLGRVLNEGDHGAATAVSRASGAQPTLRDLIANTAQSQAFAEQQVEP